jgi:hypothetical protein
MAPCLSLLLQVRGTTWLHEVRGTTCLHVRGAICLLACGTTWLLASWSLVPLSLVVPCSALISHQPQDERVSGGGGGVGGSESERASESESERASERDWSTAPNARKHMRTHGYG